MRILLFLPAGAMLDTPGTADNSFRVDFLYCLFFNPTALRVVADDL